ncbi:MAG: sulfite exporter TauE/SafE family protein [Bacteroidia bacterium]|nr:sulfite exporter TauE/SafE family protein [Bacteroidia bacterium]
MLWIGSALFIGLAGSLHCIGMCGPLMLALPGGNSNSFRFMGGRGLYHLGRTVSYSLMGLIFGLFGQGISLIGMQRGLSIILAVGLVLAIFIPQWENRLSQIPWMKKIFFTLRNSLGKSLRNPSLPSMFNTGILNGFLPCGMVYIALAAAMTQPSWWQSVAFMTFFGLGTFPATYGISMLGKFIPKEKINRIRPVFQTLAILLILLLMIRGLDLGIPYLSPGGDIPSEISECH